MKELYLYTTLGCHLCEDAEKILQSVLSHLRMRDGLSEDALQLVPVEISEDENLVEAYGLRIPVIRFSHSSNELAWPFSAEEAFTFVSENWI
ncbi:MAG: glutaredoxin family protein [Pseudohongiellaceae bacterium]|nr:glutaredoxin family protein [Pseudohongiellaceae bacterium]